MQSRCFFLFSYCLQSDNIIIARRKVNCNLSRKKRTDCKSRFFCIDYFVPNRRSPASPSPGRI